MKAPRNFRLYGAVEAVNIVLLPALALWMAPPARLSDAISLIVAITACAGFLLIGAVYWLGLSQRLEKRSGFARRNTLKLADRLEVPLLVVTSAAAVSVLGTLYLSGSTPTLIAAALLTILAVLEYVNYYWWQLQYFDRRKDFLRLIRMRRRRGSHMARDLALYRYERRKRSGK